MPYSTSLRRISRAAVITAALLPAPSIAMASEVSEMYARLYERAYTLQQKQEIMVAIEEQDDPDMAPFLVNALDALVSSRLTVTGSTEKNLHTQLMRMVSKKLGELRARDAAALLYTVVKEAEDPVLKGEALAALGSIGVGSYAEKIAVILRDLNMNQGGNVQASETVASGCITALERLREPVGFVPVFDASVGWYSRRIKDAAGRAMTLMVDDPSEMLCGILRNDASFYAMLRAVETAAASSARPAGKTQVAVTALRQALLRGGRNPVEDTLLSQIRTTASVILRDQKADSKEAVPMLQQILSLDTAGAGEKMTVLEALGASGSDESAAVLISYLKWFNDRKESDIQAKDDRLLRSTIQILGDMKKRKATEELLRVKTLGYSLGPLHDAENALKKMGL